MVIRSLTSWLFNKNKSICFGISIILFPYFSDASELYHSYWLNAGKGLGSFTSLYFNGSDVTVKNNSFICGISCDAGLKFEYSKLGIGAGIAFWNPNFLFPVTLNYNVSVIKAKIAPTLAMSAGYFFGVRNSGKEVGVESGSFLIKLGLGALYRVGQKKSLQLNCCIKVQNMVASYHRSINNTAADSKKYSIPYKFICIELGYVFD